MKLIDPYKTWKYKPEFSVADTSSFNNGNYITSTVSTTASTEDLADTIARAVNRQIKEGIMLHGISGTFKGDESMDNMTYCGKPVVDISPGVTRAHVKFMDNLLYIDRPRELKITHESMADGVTLELKCDVVHSQKLYDTYDVRVYNPDKRLFPTKTPKTAEPTPKKVIFSGPATTILWKDGTKTTVKCQDEDVWADDVGIAMCYLKKMLGNKGNFNNIFRKAMKVAEVQTKKEELTSSTVIEGESYYSSALDSMKQNIDEINEFMKDAADALDKALGGKK